VPEIYCDSRGNFHETYNRKQLSEHAIDLQFVQDNQSLSLHAATIHGLHFQSFPAAQSKSFGC
jgi:dTDP-4-dehydrorhamnose 3,5-epimerase